MLPSSSYEIGGSRFSKQLLFFSQDFPRLSFGTAGWDLAFIPSGPCRDGLGVVEVVVVVDRRPSDDDANG